MARARGMAAVNGTQLAYEVAGEGPAVVFVHGFTLDQRMWGDQAPVFAERYRVVRYDLRGFGASAPPEEETPYTHADDLAALLAYLEIDQAAVVGLSLGGWVVLEFTLTCPRAVRALVLVDTAIRGYSYGPEFAATLETISRLGREGRLAEAKVRWLADPLFAGTRRIPAAARRVGQMVEEYPCWHLLYADPHPPMEPPARERLHEIAAPTFVVVGEEDLADFQTNADLLASRIRGARKLVLPGAGHMPNMEAPEAFNRGVLDFLASVDHAP
jgi:3-oxoadipate enol-lactonase